MNLSVLTDDLEKGGGTIGLVEATDALHLRRCIKGGRPGFWRDTWDVGPQRQRRRYTGRVRGAHDARQERQMTLEVSDTEKRAGVWIADVLERQPLEARTGRGEPVEAACALTLDVGNDTGTQR